MYKIIKDDGLGNAIGIKVESVLTKEDYESLIPILEQKIKQFGKVNVLVQLENFDGIKMDALWEDLKFDVKHYDDYDRIAVVGKKEWMKWMSKLSDLFVSGEVKYYKPGQEEEAWDWIREKEVIHGAATT